MLSLVRYFATLPTPRVVLWCYLVWYLTIVARLFDPSPTLWLNSLGLSAVIGVALMLSVGGGGGGDAARPRPDRWQVFRLFAMPFCVSSFSSLIKGRGFVLVFPPGGVDLLVPVAACATFVLVVMALRRVVPPPTIAPPRSGAPR